MLTKNVIAIDLAKNVLQACHISIHGELMSNKPLSRQKMKELLAKAKRRSDQEWHALFEQYEASELTQRAFCEQNNLSPSTFFARRQRLQQISTSQNSGFVKAQLYPINLKMRV